MMFIILSLNRMVHTSHSIVSIPRVLSPLSYVFTQTVSPILNGICLNLLLSLKLKQFYLFKFISGAYLCVYTFMTIQFHLLSSFNACSASSFVKNNSFPKAESSRILSTCLPTHLEIYLNSIHKDGFVHLLISNPMISEGHTSWSAGLA